MSIPAVITIAGLWLAAVITLGGLTIAASDIARHLCRKVAYSHRQRMQRVRRYQRIEHVLALHDLHERIGRHRAVWEGSLDHQPASVIAAEITDAERRRP